MMQIDALLDRPFVNRMGIKAATVPSIRDVLMDVCDRRHVTFKDLVGHRRHGNLIGPRLEAYHDCIRLTGASLPAIGRAMNKHHTTVLDGARKHIERMAGAHGAIEGHTA